MVAPVVTATVTGDGGSTVTNLRVTVTVMMAAADAGDGDTGRACQLSRRVQLQNWVGSERGFARERSPRPTRCHRIRNASPLAA